MTNMKRLEEIRSYLTVTEQIPAFQGKFEILKVFLSMQGKYRFALADVLSMGESGGFPRLHDEFKRLKRISKNIPLIHGSEFEERLLLGVLEDLPLTEKMMEHLLGRSTISLLIATDTVQGGRPLGIRQLSGELVSNDELCILFGQAFYVQDHEKREFQERLRLVLHPMPNQFGVVYEPQLYLTSPVSFGPFTSLVRITKDNLSLALEKFPMCTYLYNQQVEEELVESL